MLILLSNVAIANNDDFAVYVTVTGISEQKKIYKVVATSKSEIVLIY